MRYLLALGVIVMTGCITESPESAANRSYATDRDKVQPSPTQIPAEIDPPPVPAPGYEGPGQTPNDPPPTDEPAHKPSKS
jgi:hypothetical protein